MADVTGELVITGHRQVGGVPDVTSLKTATSVVPPPISGHHHADCFSSSVRMASLLASGSRTRSSISIPRLRMV
jgi:hypothetical protein